VISDLRLVIAQCNLAVLRDAQKIRKSQIIIHKSQMVLTTDSRQGGLAYAQGRGQGAGFFIAG
jgi:hypothetical protein